MLERYGGFTQRELLDMLVKDLQIRLPEVGLVFKGGMF